MRNKYSKTIIGAILLILLLAIVTFQAIQTSESDNAEKNIRPETQEKDLEITEEIPDDTELQKAEETEEEKQPLTEDIKDKVSQVIESALGLFVKKDLDIVAIGDSLTQGVGDTSHNGGYVGILGNTLNDDGQQKVDIVNYGKRGNRSDQLLKRLDQTEIKSSIEEADIVLVTIGANDIMKVVKNNFTNLEYEPFVKEQANYMERLRKIFDKMVELNPDATIYLIGFYNPFENYFSDVEQLGQIIDDWNSTGSTVALEYEQVNYIPTKDLFANANQDLLYEDNFHPNNTGYKLIAERVLEYIRPEIERSE
ncbi:Lysophospholipase L1 [Sediminibacillus halophilus]|uniref:Lysophospholipase L1 n=1 Tax=Sediminibacillus halophilus TaxID=482461 RepID=A0A1G9TPU9_9BACI|nr:SGNH/GDSL hydrolase family protein [Sediminibacillus halophilus]SDM49733.1 Lysophospholipase L1 [Sediminibacillus halophilus]